MKEDTGQQKMQQPLLRWFNGHHFCSNDIAEKIFLQEMLTGQLFLTGHAENNMST